MELTNKDILCVLYTAKSKFITDRNSHNYAYGMCFYLANTIYFPSTLFTSTDSTTH